MKMVLINSQRAAEWKKKKKQDPTVAACKSHLTLKNTHKLRVQG